MIFHVVSAFATHGHHQIILTANGSYKSAKECTNAPYSGDDDIIEDQVQSTVFDDLENVFGSGDKGFAVDGDFAVDKWGDELKGFVDQV